VQQIAERSTVVEVYSHIPQWQPQFKQAHSVVPLRTDRSTYLLKERITIFQHGQLFLRSLRGHRKTSILLYYPNTGVIKW
jgi:hypothetical protein